SSGTCSQEAISGTNRSRGVPRRHRRPRRRFTTCETVEARACRISAPLHDLDRGTARVHAAFARPLSFASTPKPSKAAGHRLGDHRRTRDGTPSPSNYSLLAVDIGSSLARLPSRPFDPLAARCDGDLDAAAAPGHESSLATGLPRIRREGIAGP